MKKDKIKTFRDKGLDTYISISLKSISQVMLLENPVSGLIILLGITIADYRLGIVTIISAIIGNLVGIAGGVDKDILEKGLLGYNSVLTGIALSSFLAGNIRYEIAIVGAGFAAIITAALINFLKKIDIPVLTIPYMILTWLFLLASFHLKIFELSPTLTPQDLSKWELVTTGPLDFLGGIVNGIGQVYFQNKFLVGLLILIGIFWGNYKFGIYTVLGTALGWSVAYVLGAEHVLINLGLYGYNAVLTMIAVSLVFDVDRPFAKVAGCIAAIVTVPFTAGINTWLSVYGLPVLTMPFVIVTWFFISAQKVLPKL